MCTLRLTSCQTTQTGKSMDTTAISEILPASIVCISMPFKWLCDSWNQPSFVGQMLPMPSQLSNSEETCWQFSVRQFLSYATDRQTLHTHHNTMKYTQGWSNKSTWTATLTGSCVIWMQSTQTHTHTHTHIDRQTDRRTILRLSWTKTITSRYNVTFITTRQHHTENTLYTE